MTRGMIGSRCRAVFPDVITAANRVALRQFMRPAIGGKDGAALQQQYLAVRVLAKTCGENRTR